MNCHELVARRLDNGFAPLVGLALADCHPKGLQPALMRLNAAWPTRDKAGAWVNRRCVDTAFLTTEDISRLLVTICT